MSFPPGFLHSQFECCIDEMAYIVGGRAYLFTINRLAVLQSTERHGFDCNNQKEVDPQTVNEAITAGCVQINGGEEPLEGILSNVT